MREQGPGTREQGPGTREQGPETREQGPGTREQKSPARSREDSGNVSVLRPRSFRDLIVWQRAVELAVEIYRLTDDFPKSEMYGLSSQLRRASVSIASNIAEGYGRTTKGEYVQFLGHARGSLCEVQTQLVIAQQLGLSSESKRERCEGFAHEVGKMLNAILEKIRN